MDGWKRREHKGIEGEGEGTEGRKQGERGREKRERGGGGLKKRRTGKGYFICWVLTTHHNYIKFPKSISSNPFKHCEAQAFLPPYSKRKN